MDVAGATHRDLALTADESIAAHEAAALRRELTRTSLFRVVAAPAASARVELSRRGELVEARVTSPHGRLLGVAHERWPRVPGPEVTAGYGGQGAPAWPATFDRAAEFEQRHLSVVKRAPELPTAPEAMGFRTGEPAPELPPFAGWGWTQGFAVPPPPQAHEAWTVLRGDGRLLTDADLAQTTARPDLADSLVQAQADRRLLWTAGFGTLAAAALAGGLVFATSADRELAGGVLITVGAVSAGVAALFSLFGGRRGHGLDEDQAQTLVDAYNERLLRGLDLVPR